MSIEAIVRLKKQLRAGRMSELIASDRLVLKMLAEYCGPSGECFADIRTFTTEAGLARRTIVDILQKLEKLGYIRREQRWYPSGVQAPSLITVIGSGEALGLTTPTVEEEAERVAAVALANLSITPDGKSTPYQVRHTAQPYAADRATLSGTPLNPTRYTAQNKERSKEMVIEEKKDGRQITAEQTHDAKKVLDWWKAQQNGLTLSTNDVAKATRNIVDLLAAGYTPDQIITYWGDRNRKENRLVPAKFIHDDLPGVASRPQKGATDEPSSPPDRYARYASLRPV